VTVKKRGVSSEMSRDREVVIAPTLEGQLDVDVLETQPPPGGLIIEQLPVARRGVCRSVNQGH